MLFGQWRKEIEIEKMIEFGSNKDLDLYKINESNDVLSDDEIIKEGIDFLKSLLKLSEAARSLIIPFIYPLSQIKRLGNI